MAYGPDALILGVAYFMLNGQKIGGVRYGYKTVDRISEVSSAGYIDYEVNKNADSTRGISLFQGNIIDVFAADGYRSYIVLIDDQAETVTLRPMVSLFDDK